MNPEDDYIMMKNKMESMEWMVRGSMLLGVISLVFSLAAFLIPILAWVLR